MVALRVARGRARGECTIDHRCIIVRVHEPQLILEVNWGLGKDGSRVFVEKSTYVAVAARTTR